MRRTGVDWRSVILGHEKSGLSQRSYCEKHDLAHSTFTYWKRKLNRAATAIEVFKPQFIELDLQPAVLPVHAPEEVVVELPCGVVMRFRADGALSLLEGRSGRVFAYSHPVDMRKGFNGLESIITQAMNEDPLSGDTFVFVNRRGQLLKCFLWDRTG